MRLTKLKTRGETNERESGQEKSKADDRVSFGIIKILPIFEGFRDINYHQGSIVYQDTGKVSTLPR